MRLLKLRARTAGNQEHIVLSKFSPYFTFPHFHLTLLFSALFIASISATDARESHLLPARWSSDQNHGGTGIPGFNNFIRSRRGRTLLEEQGSPLVRNDRVEKQTFRLELLRQIKAIDHMKCFPKVLCGLSVESDKSFGINKSNFVRSYLELMRNVKPPQAGADERERTDDEVEGELTWPFSPHNPERKDHSSFERISSAALSASVEVPDQDSMEYLRGLSSQAHDDLSSISEEKQVNRRMGSVEESKEKLDSPINRMDSSKIPGDKKKKKNSNKSLTSKLTSYFTSWLPEIVSFSKDRAGDSVETDLDMEDAKRVKRSMNDDNNSQLPTDVLENIPPELRSLIERSRQLRDEAETDGATDTVSTGGHEAARDDIKIDSAEHDADIYHTAVNIGKRLKDPKQCDYIYNGCPLEYNSILQMINSIRTEITPEEESLDTAEAVSQELGLDGTSSTTTTTSTTTTEATTKRPQRKKTKPRPSTKIMHVLPNGEKVEINFRLGGSEDSDESSSSAQRDPERKELSDDSSSERSSKETVVFDVGQRSEEEMSNDKKMSNRKGTPPGLVVVRKSNKNKISYVGSKSNLKNGDQNENDQNDESDVDLESTKPFAFSRTGLLKQNNPTIKLNGLSLSTSNDEQPLEISPSYVIIKHQPLSVHTSVLSPDNVPTQGSHPADKLQAFQLIQGGQKLGNNDQLADQLKNYIRQHGGLIPKLSLQSSGLITSDAAESISNSQKLYSMKHSSDSDSMTTSQKIQDAYSSHRTDLTFEPVKQQSSNMPFSPPFPQSALSSFSFHRNGPEMIGSVPGRLDSLISPKTTTTTSTTSTTTENINLPGMAETVTFDTDEITDDTLKKLSSQNVIPGYLETHAQSHTTDSKEKDSEMSLLENLNKSLLRDSGSKTRYKNPKKKRTRVKANTSRVRASVKRNKKKGNNKDSSERVVIKHAGPYNSSPTMYQSPLQGPGPHGGAYPYLPMGAMKPNVFPGYPFWRL